MVSRLLYAAVGAVALVASCTLISETSLTQCVDDEGCSAFEGATCQDSVCVVGIGGGGGTGGVVEDPCATNQECIDRNGGLPFVCKKDTSTCFNVLSQDCTRAIGDIQNDDAFIIGQMTLLNGPAPLPEFVNAAELAADEFDKASGGIPSASGKRPIVIVVCDDNDDWVRSARHLVEGVGVKAIIGPTNSEHTLEVANEVAIPNDVFVISSISASASLESLQDNDLVWHTRPVSTGSALAIAQFLPSYEGVVRDAFGLGNDPDIEPIKVAVITTNETGGTALLDEFVENAMFNGGLTPTRNASNFEVIQYDAENPDYGSAVSQAEAFGPDIIFANTADDLDLLLAPLESTLSKKPFYIITQAGVTNQTLDIIGNSADLDDRLIGVRPALPADASLFDSFSVRYLANFTGAVFSAMGGTYDSVYLIAYAAVASGDEVITGTSIANGMKKLVPPAPEKADVGPSKINEIFQALSTGGSRDFNGTSGPLDFNLSTGFAPGDFEFFCSDLVPSGVRWNAQTESISGTFSCF